MTHLDLAVKSASSLSIYCDRESSIALTEMTLTNLLHVRVKVSYTVNKHVRHSGDANCILMVMFQNF